MGSLGGGCDGLRRAENVEMGTDSAHSEGDHKHDGGAGRNHLDWTDEPYYNEQFAENNGHDESVFEWSDDRKFQDWWEDNREHEPDEFQWTDGRDYQEQYDNMGSGGSWRENGVPSGT